mgnify:CR=1 FL=1
MHPDVLLACGVTLGCGVFTGAGTYFLARRDFSRRVAGWSAVGCGVLSGAVSLFVLYLVVPTFLVATVAYLVLRRLLRPRPALTLAGTAYLAGLGCCVLVMTAALQGT